MKTAFRVETDSMGEMRVPGEAYYGAQTARAVENFPISGWRFPRSLNRALGLIKKHAALTNAELGGLDARLAAAIQQAAGELAEGKFESDLVVDVFQTGSGTSTNMNVNEVIANRAAEMLGGARGDRSVHPNDHVNLGQSSNDVIPSAIHLAALDGIERRLIPALRELQGALGQKSRDLSAIFKVGRTHLQDATPVTLGNEFSGYATQVEHAVERLRRCEHFLGELALGGTAVGTGVNTHSEFAPRTVGRLAAETGLPLREAENHFEAQAARDACLEASGAIKSAAMGLAKIANDIRWLASGPRAGLGELKLPPTQPGSSIMPGKVNPVMCEMVLQVAAQIVGADAAITFGVASGNLELNTMMPVIGYNLLLEIELLANAAETFSRRCVAGVEADADRCRSSLARSLSLATALAPAIGYDRTAQIVKEAADSGRTLMEVARERSGLAQADLDRLLDPARLRS
jgi:fumarate hydratase class II